MPFRLAVAILPAVVGWGLGIYFQFRAMQHLRADRRVARLLPFFLAPFGGQFYTLEGFRYRGLAMLSAFAGMALTFILIVVLNP
jgi:hypothetical protein